MPANGNLGDLTSFITKLSDFDPIELFGLHPNAMISSAIIETNSFCSKMLSMLPRSGGT